MTLQLDRAAPAIVVRSHRRDLIGATDSVRILGSLGASAQWNDDIRQPAILSLPQAVRDLARDRGAVPWCVHRPSPPIDRS